MTTDDERRKTSEIQLIVDRRISKQAELCEVHLARVKDRIGGIEQDTSALAAAVERLRDQIVELTAQLAALNLKVENQIEDLQRRWKIWPTLKDLTLLSVAIGSLVVALTR